LSELLELFSLTKPERGQLSKMTDEASQQKGYSKKVWDRFQKIRGLIKDNFLPYLKDKYLDTLREEERAKFAKLTPATTPQDLVSPAEYALLEDLRSVPHKRGGFYQLFTTTVNDTKKGGDEVRRCNRKKCWGCREAIVICLKCTLPMTIPRARIV